MTLNEIAVRLGVETQYVYKTTMDIGSGYGHELRQRPALAIAHDVLAKLPVRRFTLEWTQRGNETEQKWEAFDYTAKQEYREDPLQPIFIGTFEQAVVALAERYLTGADAPKDERE